MQTLSQTMTIGQDVPTPWVVVRCLSLLVLMVVLFMFFRGLVGALENAVDVYRVVWERAINYCIFVFGYVSFFSIVDFFVKRKTLINGDG